MKGIALLQLATVLTFIIFAGLGVFLVIAMPDRIPAYSQLLGAIWPIFMAEVIPAFLGSSLKEYVKGIVGKISTPQ